MDCLALPVIGWFSYLFLWLSHLFPHFYKLNQFIGYHLKKIFWYLLMFYACLNLVTISYLHPRWKDWIEISWKQWKYVHYSQGTLNQTLSKALFLQTHGLSEHIDPNYFNSTASFGCDRLKHPVLCSHDILESLNILESMNIVGLPNSTMRDLYTSFA